MHLLDVKMIDMNFSTEDNGNVMVQLDFEPRQGSYKEKLRLEFRGIKEFVFYYDETTAFYYLDSMIARWVELGASCCTITQP
jgi:hypothetical protein